METFTKQETYIREFDPHDYFDTYYSPKAGALSGEWLKFALTNLHEAFSQGGVKGKNLIDIGAGPAIYQLLTACEVFETIITSDFLEQNRTELQKWLKNEQGALDWMEIVKFVCNLEGNSESWEKKEEKLRRTVKLVLKCDVLKRNPFEPLILQPADCIISCLCLEAPCQDVVSYCTVLKNLKDLLKPGGHILIQSALNSTFYFVGEKRFSSLKLTKEDLKKVFEEAGYEIEKIIVAPREDMSRMDISDYDSYYYVHARKPLTA
ncbi:indolethylamine N-methyltransferase-like [Spea bombifrons]|uniref:indolethylamine N-methyltransferase-like n=1 Tax=Spea bombifrons TaxID=233779 RepID=UPI00234AFB0E|nr:indolethylamine N-methyltransferase-like [Spea bombifrons]